MFDSSTYTIHINVCTLVCTVCTVQGYMLDSSTYTIHINMCTLVLYCGYCMYWVWVHVWQFNLHIHISMYFVYCPRVHVGQLNLHNSHKYVCVPYCLMCEHINIVLWVLYELRVLYELCTMYMNCGYFMSCVYCLPFKVRYMLHNLHKFYFLTNSELLTLYHAGSGYG